MTDYHLPFLISEASDLNCYIYLYLVMDCRKDAHLDVYLWFVLFPIRIVCEVGSVPEKTEGEIEVDINGKRGQSTNEVRFTYQVSVFFCQYLTLFHS